jgi:hypothetical protein
MDLTRDDVASLADDELLAAYAESERTVSRLTSMALGLHRVHELLAAELSSRIGREADELTRLRSV